MSMRESYELSSTTHYKHVGRPIRGGFFVVRSPSGPEGDWSGGGRRRLFLSGEVPGRGEDSGESPGRKCLEATRENEIIASMQNQGGCR